MNGLGRHVAAVNSPTTAQRQNIHYADGSELQMKTRLLAQRLESQRKQEGVTGPEIAIADIVTPPAYADAKTFILIFDADAVTNGLIAVAGGGGIVVDGRQIDDRGPERRPETRKSDAATNAQFGAILKTFKLLHLPPRPTGPP